MLSTLRRIIGRARKPEISPKKPGVLPKLFILGRNHYDLKEIRHQVLRMKVIEGTTHLCIDNSGEEFALVALPLEPGGYTPFSVESLEKKAVDVTGINFVQVLRPDYLITEDGRLFTRGELIPEHWYNEAIEFVRNYKIPEEEQI